MSNTQIDLLLSGQFDQMMIKPYFARAAIDLIIRLINQRRGNHLRGFESNGVDLMLMSSDDCE